MSAYRKRRKILFAVTDGQSLQLLGRIPTRLRQLGWDVEIVASLGSRKIPANLEGFVVHDIPMVRSPAPVRDLRSLSRWISLVRSMRPDVVSIGTPKAAFLGLLASFLCGVPVRVYHLRGLRLETEKALARHLLRIIEGATAWTSTKILAVSKSLREEYCSSGLSHPDKVIVLGQGSSKGVDLQHFDPSKWASRQLPTPAHSSSLLEPRVRLGYVGRASRDKGVGDLVFCLRQIEEATVPYSLLVVGPTKEEMGSLEEFASEKSVPIEVTGEVDDTAPYYSLMDILLLPTRREGFPNVVLEAAAFRVPTVTMRVTGAMDAVLNQETGVVVTAGDLFAFADAVKALSLDPGRRARLGENARKRVEAHFNHNHIADLHADFYNKLHPASSFRFCAQ